MLLFSVINWIKMCRNWPVRILEFFGFSKEYVTYKFRNGLGLRMHGGNSDSVVLSDLYTNNPYAIENLKDGDIVVDIGAHVGIFSSLAAISAKDVSVFSYEPTPNNFRLLKHNIRQNKLRNVKIFMRAVHKKRSILNFFINSAGSSGHSLFKEVPAMPSGKKIRVKTVTLPDVFKAINADKIDFLKMDCEGSEYPILMDNRDLVKKIGFIALEWHNVKGYKVEDLVRFLKSNNFRVKKTMSGGRTMVAKNLSYKP